MDYYRLPTDFKNFNLMQLDHLPFIRYIIYYNTCKIKSSEDIKNRKIYCLGNQSYIMNWTSAIIVSLIPWHCTAKYSSFIASFQPLGDWSETEYLEYKESLPELKVFTVCHWEKTQFFSEQLHAIWAYCQQNSQNMIRN